MNTTLFHLVNNNTKTIKPTMPNDIETELKNENSNYKTNTKNK